MVISTFFVIIFYHVLTTLQGAREGSILVSTSSSKATETTSLLQLQLLDDSEDIISRGLLVDPLRLSVRFNLLNSNSAAAAAAAAVGQSTGSAVSLDSIYFDEKLCEGKRCCCVLLFVRKLLHFLLFCICVSFLAHRGWDIL